MKSKTIIHRHVSFALLLLTGALISFQPARAEAQKPNIIVILADDMGFSDLGCFGSEIQTPHLDQLAKNGLRMTQFYNMSRCCPSRAALLTGLYPHQAGVGSMTKNEGTPAFQGYLNEKCVTLAEVLKSAGYSTAIAGKWHVGGETFQVTPWMRGFDHGIATISGGFYYPDKNAEAKKNGEKGALWLDGENIPNDSPKLSKNWYTTDLYADYGIQYINAAVAEKKPFFVYLPFNAPHWPLMAPEADVSKYREIYKAGWDVLREERYQRHLKLGIIDPTWGLSSPKSQRGLKDIPSWESLTAEQKERSVKIMSLYAACVDHLDQSVGKIVENLKTQGVFDNTLILFFSDNGGCSEGPLLGLYKEPQKSENSFGPFAYCGQAWATLENTPFRYYKHWEHEGGISSSFIAHWPNGIKAQGSLCKEPGHIIDIMPTCVEVAGASYPAEYQGHKILPMEGTSLVPVFSGGKMTRDALYWEHLGNAAILEGDWKLVRVKDGPWELYDLLQDRTELKDLAAAEPERGKALEAHWNTWAERVGVFEKKNKASQKANPKQMKSEEEKTDTHSHDE